MRLSGRLALLVALVVSAAAAAAAAGGVDGRPAGLILYWSDDPWPSIWSVRPDGSRSRRILRNRQNAKRPRLAPNGRLVAFDGTPPGKPVLSDFDLQVVRLDGGGLRTLTRGKAWDLDASWSPDGRRLAFSRHPPHPDGCGGASVWVVGANGRGARRVTAGCGARWAPDGRRLVHASRTGRELRVAPLRGGRARTLLRVPAGESVSPAAWSVDGSTILFNRFRTGGYGASVYVVAAAGGESRRLGDGVAAAWSPDGSRILLTEGFVGRLVVMDADGSNRRRLDVIGSEPDWGKRE